MTDLMSTSGDAASGAAPILRWPTWIGAVVNDLAEARAFFRDAIGLPELASGETWVWFDMGWPRLLELVDRSSQPPGTQPGFIVGFAVDDVERARDTLIARGAEPVGEIGGGPDLGGRWAEFRGPGQLRFEIKQTLGSGWPPPPA